MAQKEIVYLSFGSFSNHISTHFWNQQQSYFIYDDETAPTVEDEQLIDHDVSFRVGEDIHGNATYHPRTVVFEAQQEFGALHRYQALSQAFDDEKTPLDALATWSTKPQVVAQEQAPMSEYQLNDDDEVQGAETRHRFWSDYARVPYHARSLVSVGGQMMAPMHGSTNANTSSQTQDGRNCFETFAQGRDMATQLEQDQEVIDDNLRWFAEDADLLQGFQYTIDTSTGFGGLGSSYLERCVDEYSKISHLVFGAAWGANQPGTNDDSADRLARTRSVNEIFCLVRFLEHATLTAPLRVPEAGGDWSRNMDRGDWSNMHHASAIVSTHLETATLGPRLRSRTESLASLCARLNWRRDTKLVHLGGCLPLSYPTALGAKASATGSKGPVEALLASYGYEEKRDRDHRAPQRGEPLESEADLAERGSHLLLASWLDLSLPATSSPLPRKKLLYNLQNPFATTAVLRNSRMDSLPLSLGILSRFVKINPPFGQGVYMPLSYNLPSSYPDFWSKEVGRQSKIPVVSALATTPSSVSLLREARATLTHVIEGHRPLQAWGLDPTTDDRDTLKDMREIIESSIDTYNINSIENDEDQMGTDEEFEPGHNPLDNELDWD